MAVAEFFILLLALFEVGVGVGLLLVLLLLLLFSAAEADEVLRFNAAVECCSFSREIGADGGSTEEFFDMNIFTAREMEKGRLI